MNNSEDYKLLTDLMFRLINSQAGMPISTDSGWLNDAQTLSIKLFRHLASMQTVSCGTTIETNSIPVHACIDHASVKVLARASLETYLVFYYIYGNGINTTAEYRHNTWELAGLSDRQKLHVSIEEHASILKQEKVRITELQSLIAETNEFLKLSEKQQKRILGGEWRVGQAWSDLGKNAGFNEKYFKNIYGYLCGYSHSSYISALQVGQAQDIEVQQMLSESMMTIGIVVMAHFAHSYSSLFEPANNVFSLDMAAKEVAEKWHFGAEDMEGIYGR